MIEWWWLLVMSVIGGAGTAVYAESRYERGLHLGVTWPRRACKLLNRRGYDMHYMMDKLDE